MFCGFESGLTAVGVQPGNRSPPRLGHLRRRSKFVLQEWSNPETGANWGVGEPTFNVKRMKRNGANPNSANCRFTVFYLVDYFLTYSWSWTTRRKTVRLLPEVGVPCFVSDGELSVGPSKSQKRSLGEFKSLILELFWLVFIFGSDIRYAFVWRSLIVWGPSMTFLRTQLFLAASTMS